MARAPEREDGKTNVGSQRVQGQLHIETVGSPSKMSLLVLDGVNATTGAVTSWYFWVTEAGVLRVANAKPTAEGDGAAV